MVRGEGRGGEGGFVYRIGGCVAGIAVVSYS